MTIQQLVLIAPDLPDAPTIGTAYAGNTQAEVNFTPGPNGGTTVTVFTATSTPGSITGTSASSPITVTGLTNGVAYTFTVKATNSVGQGPASSSSNSITPTVGTTTPGAPTIGTPTRGNQQVSLTFTPPASDGGSPITSYNVTGSPSGSASGASSPIVIGSLTNGTAYTFTVTATNAVGTGPASAASASSTPATTPGIPTIGTATKGNTTASVAFTAPASDGGSAITLYTATSSPGAITGTAASSPISVTGLTNGTAYTFTVKATNAVGQGSASGASNSVTPSTVPGAPTIGTAIASSQSATVAYTAPASNGGATITSYTATSNPGGNTGSGTTSPLTVNGLTNGTAYTFTVKAENLNGLGAASAASNSVTPSVQVNITDQSSFGASPTYVLNSSGSATIDGTGISGEWRVTGASADYEAKWAMGSYTGTKSHTYAAGGYHGLSASNTWSIGANSSFVFTVTIRRVSDAVVLDSATITLDNR